MIKFKYVKFKNFLSRGNKLAEIQLDRGNKLVLIAGTNGVGKSLIIDAITFGLFGKPYRKIKKEQIINNINKKGLYVEIEFEKNNNTYKIIRGIKPNKFEIYKNDSKIKTNAGVKDYQGFLEEDILGFNRTIFQQMICISAMNYTPFFQLSSTEKHKVKETLFELEIFNAMKVITKEYIKKAKTKVEEHKSQIELLQEKIKLNKEFLKKQEEEDKEKKEKIEKEIKEYEKEIKELKTKLRNLQLGLQKLNIIEEKIEKLEDEIDELKSEKRKFRVKIKDIEERLEFFEDNEVCPVCSQDITKEFKNSKIKEYRKQIENFKKKLKNVDKLIDGKEQKVEEIEEKELKPLEEQKVEVKNIKFKIKHIENEIIKLNKELTKETKKQTIDLDSMKNELKELQNKLRKVEKSKKILDKILLIVSDDGIKKYIIKKYVPYLNKYIALYLEKLGLPVSITFDNNLDLTISGKGYVNYSYYNFSAGERLRIDFAIIFAFLNLIQNRLNVKTNILFIDEIFDGAADNEGIDSLYSILKTFNQTIYIISHRFENKEKFDNVIEVYKQGKFTQFKEE